MTDDELLTSLEAPDGVLDLARIVAAAPFRMRVPQLEPWRVAGAMVASHRRALTDAAVLLEVPGTGLRATVAQRAAGACNSTDHPADALAVEVARGLAVEAWQRDRSGPAALPSPAQFLALQRDVAVFWERTVAEGPAAGWRCGRGTAHAADVRVAANEVDGTAVVVGVLGAGEQEILALVAALRPMQGDPHLVAECQDQVRHRLASRWTDAPRVPLRLAARG